MLSDSVSLPDSDVVPDSDGCRGAGDSPRLARRACRPGSLQRRRPLRRSSGNGGWLVSPGLSHPQPHAAERPSAAGPGSLPSRPTSATRDACPAATYTPCRQLPPWHHGRRVWPSCALLAVPARNVTSPRRHRRAPSLPRAVPALIAGVPTP